MTDEFTNPTNSNSAHQSLDRTSQLGDHQRSDQPQLQPDDSEADADQAAQPYDQPTASPETTTPGNDFDRNNIDLLGFRLIGYGLLALTFLDLGHAALPARFMNPAWELEVIEALAARVPVFFIGLVMVLYQKRASGRGGQRLLSRILAGGVVTIACLYFLTIPLTISNSLRQDNAYYNQIKSQLLQISNQTQQLQDNIDQASDSDILRLLEQVENQEQLGNAANPQEFKTEASEQIQQFDLELVEQADAILWEQRVANIKNSLRLVLGGIVAGIVLLRLRLMAMPRARQGYTEKEVRSLNLARLPGYGLLFLGMANYVITLLPAQLNNPNWGIFSTSYVAELAPIPILGLALVFYRSTQGRRRFERPLLKILSWFTLMLAIAFALLTPIVVVYSLQQNRQNNELLEAQAVQATVQNEQLRNQIENSSTAEIAILIEQQTLRGRPPASQDPEKLRILALEDLEERQQNLQIEVAATKKQQSQFLLRNFFKRLAESIVLSGLFLYVWRATYWAREARYDVIARRRRRPKGKRKK
jgi:hypothetical protein